MVLDCCFCCSTPTLDSHRLPHSLCDVLNVDTQQPMRFATDAIVHEWRSFRHSLSPHAVIFFDDIDERHPVWAEPGLMRVGCTSLSGVADDKRRALPMGAAESFCVAVHQHDCVRRGKGCTPNTMIDDAGDSEWGERAVAERFSRGCMRVLELGGGSGSVSAVIQRHLADGTRHVVVQPDQRMGMMGGYRRLLRNRAAQGLRYHAIDHLLQPGEGGEVTRRLSGAPDCIVADCEDCLWGEYRKNPGLFAGARQIQVERDDENGNYQSLFDKLGMERVHVGRGCGVHEPNRFHVEHGMRCTTEVWERRPP